MKRFYCENCGAEVSESSSICPECGAFFVAIKCPRCGYRAKAHEFRNGCPRCGYLGESQPGKPGTDISRRRSIGGFRRSDRERYHTREARQVKPLPSWFFWLALAILGAAFAVLARIYTTI